MVRKESAEFDIVIRIYLFVYAILRRRVLVFPSWLHHTHAEQGDRNNYCTDRDTAKVSPIMCVFSANVSGLILLCCGGERRTKRFHYFVERLLRKMYHHTNSTIIPRWPGLFLCPGLEWLGDCNIHNNNSNTRAKAEDERTRWRVVEWHLTIYLPRTMPLRRCSSSLFKNLDYDLYNAQNWSVGHRAKASWGWANRKRNSVPLEFYFNLFKSPLNDPPVIRFYRGWELLFIGR